LRFNIGLSMACLTFEFVSSDVDPDQTFAPRKWIMKAAPAEMVTMPVSVAQRVPRLL